MELGVSSGHLKYVKLNKIVNNFKCSYSHAVPLHLKQTVFPKHLY